MLGRMSPEVLLDNVKEAQRLAQEFAHFASQARAREDETAAAGYETIARHHSQKAEEYKAALRT